MPPSGTSGLRSLDGPLASMPGTCAVVFCTALMLNGGIQAAPPLCVSDEGIHCFSRAGLDPLWQRHQGRTTHDPAALGELLLAGADDGVTAFAKDGTSSWQLLEYGHAFTPTVAHDHLFFGTLGGDLVSASADGSVRWHRRFSGWLYSPAVIGMVVVSGGQAGELHAVHRLTGETLWERPLDQELVNRPAEVDDSHFAVTTFAGTLLKLDARTGRAVWRYSFGVPSKTPVVAGGQLLCALFDGRVAAVAAADGELLWETTLPAAVEIAAGSKWVAAYDEGGLVVLGMQDGRVLQRRDFAAPIVAARWQDAERVVVFLRGVRNQVRAEAVSFKRGTRHTKETEE